MNPDIDLPDIFDEKAIGMSTRGHAGGRGHTGLAHPWARELAKALNTPEIIRKRSETLSKLQGTKQVSVTDRMREAGAKVGQANLGKPKPRGTCPHCGKTAALNMLARWHGNNCRQRA